MTFPFRFGRNFLWKKKVEMRATDVVEPKAEDAGLSLSGELLP
jgi:hypothetical protein